MENYLGDIGSLSEANQALVVQYMRDNPECSRQAVVAYVDSLNNGE